ncbi:acetylxylan esterase [Mucilaginibacter sabulilitoris]|uniref:Acetylxylan esterase n=1 Tax=Mucilaginibacter sabulilitoris TaxID=1173583 RepID=A0ABZ0TLZ8_9SPHI|nr:acetylxylan esterase [Mucilaginibacter sabulilitoris]WPU93427.1 acetylxylan esterase [Mucilaginibacter sabulilitoris]
MIKTVNKFKYLLLILLISAFVIGNMKAMAGNTKPHPKPLHTQPKDDDEEVVTNLIAHSDDGIFNSNASYTFEVKNTYHTDQEGRVAYVVTTPAGKPVAKDSVSVKISKNSSNSYHFTVPAMKPGFYKINFMINVSDYDDTTRRAFGIRPKEIRSGNPRPADFDSFWQTAKTELAAVEPNYKVTEKPELEKDNRRVFLFEMKSLDNITVRGWLTIPKGSSKSRRFPVFVGLPGYQVDLKPMLGEDEDLAILTINVRGQGNSRDVIHTKREDYITLNIEDKNKYVLRGAIMDCVRTIDFICSRPDLDPERIEISGGSMGGFLAVALASLDSRVKLVSAQNPILGDIRNLVGVADWPMNDIKKYVDNKPGLSFPKILDNLDYFDIKNFAPTIKSPILVGIGLLDPLAPPANEFAFYNNIPSKYGRIRIFKDLGHEVPKSFLEEDGHWMRDTFGLF